MADKVTRDGFDDGGLAAFGQMLDAYGAEPSRWPSERRPEAAILLRLPGPVGDAARRALAEARALDALLAVAPAIDTVRVDALASRIVERVRMPAPAATIVRLSPPQARASARPVAVRQGNWGVAALLAASLMVGIVIGPGSSGLPALHDLADAIGFGNYVDQIASAPLDDEGVVEEDVL